METRSQSVKTQLSQSEFIIRENSNNWRSVSFGLIPQSVLMDLKTNCIEFKFEYSIDEEAELLTALNDNSIKIYVGKFTSKLIKIVFNNLTSENVTDFLQVIIMQLNTSIEIEVNKGIKRNYTAVLKFFKLLQKNPKDFVIE